MSDFARLWKKVKSIDVPDFIPYPGFRPGEYLLEKGYTHAQGAASLPCAIRYLRDNAVKMRDGVTIYSDIFLPADQPGPFPVVLAYIPYGKIDISNRKVIMLPKDGVDTSKLSHLQSWEALDPARWCPAGYVVCQADARGAFMSEGNIHFWGTQEGEDEYDLIEWLASQAWCNGKIGMAGNSWLAVTQYFAAAQQPPHLAAIAPWEGLNDMLADDLLNGGIPNIKFLNFICDFFRSNNYIEDVGAMLTVHPYRSEYWNDKRVELEKIKCPAYFVASYSNPLHTRGTFESFSKIASQDKWLRVHNTHEWDDFYKDEVQEDLMRFMDCYLKGIDNGWKSTPKVRLSVLDPGGTDIVNRPEEDWPLPQMKPVRFYLRLSDGKLAEERDLSEQAALIDAPDQSVTFELVFSEYTEIIGPSKLLLWVEAIGCDDVEINASFYKADPAGNPLPTYHGYSGPENILRVSRRDLDKERSTLLEPKLSFEKIERLAPGEVVPAEIALWATGLVFHPAERLVLKIRAGILDAVVPGSVPVPKMEEFPGSRAFHCGGKYDSQLVLPIVGSPGKSQSRITDET